MFNPLKVLSSNHDDIYEIQEAESLSDLYFNDVNGFSNQIRSNHKELINYQKDLFTRLIDSKSETNEVAYKIITKKNKIYIDSTMEYLHGSVLRLSKFLIKHNKNTDEQIRIIKTFWSRSKYAAYKNKYYQARPIGFKTIELPTIEEYKEALEPYKRAWKLMKKLDNDSIIKRFKECFQSKTNLREKMNDEIEYYFKENKMYKAQEYVDKYDEMNEDMIRLLAAHKRKYEAIRNFLTDVRVKSASAYEEDIFDIKKTITDQQEREEIINTATYNYKILSNTLIFLTELVTVYHTTQLKILITSYTNYRKNIQEIYSDLMMEL